MTAPASRSWRHVEEEIAAADAAAAATAAAEEKVVVSWPEWSERR
jgi:hypothetical protein